MIITSIFIIISTPLFFKFIDSDLYELYLYLNFEVFYTDIDIFTAHILTILHSVIFFFSTFKKVGL